MVDPAPPGIFITEIPAVGPLPPGRRLAVKDLFDTAGVRTTYGSAVFGEHVPASSASAVTLLEDAGYVVVGKTNLHEFAYGITSQNDHYGTVPNPAAPGRSTGGSSGGSAAAIAGGYADVALGTDTGGSIRIPAACCNIVGFKPTFGLVPIDGVFPLAPSFDHAGPMSRDVAGCLELVRVLCPNESWDTTVAPGSLRVALAWSAYAEPLVGARVAEAAVLLGAVTPVTFPEPHGTLPAFQQEIADVHRDLYAEFGELYGESIGIKIERCLNVSEAEAALARTERARYAEAALAALDGFDVLVTPTLAFVAPPADSDELEIRDSVVRFTYPFDVLGWPTIALPCGVATDGLQASVQIAGRPGSDAFVLAAAAALEAALSATVAP